VDSERVDGKLGAVETIAQGQRRRGALKEGRGGGDNTQMPNPVFWLGAEQKGKGR